MRYALAILAIAFLSGCALPVRNENNDKPLLVAPVGTAQLQADGSTVYNGNLPQPKAEDYQHDPGIDPWKIGGLLALLIGGPVAYKGVQRIQHLTQCVKDAAQYGEAMEAAETDGEADQVKIVASHKQAANGTIATIQRIRGK